MRSRLLTLFLVAAFVSLGVTTKTSAAPIPTLNLNNITCNSVTISSTFLPSVTFEAAVLGSLIGIPIGPIVDVTTDGSGNFSATLSYSAPAGQQVIAATEYGAFSFFTV